MIESLKNLITAKQTANNNSCGTTMLTLANELKITYNELKPLLSNLYKDKFIQVRKGINHELIFLRRFTIKR